MDEQFDAVGRDGATKEIVRKTLWTATGLLGLSAWAVALAASAQQGSAVPLAVAAGVVAAVGLLPGQPTRGWLCVAATVVALTDTVAATVASGGSGWGRIVVDVVIALQAVVALFALLLDGQAPSATPSAPDDGVNAYEEYVRAYQEYARNYETRWAEQHSEANVVGEARAEAVGSAVAEQDARADLHAKYARHLNSTVGHRVPTPVLADGTVDAGLPGVGLTERPHRTENRMVPRSTGSQSY